MRLGIWPACPLACPAASKPNGNSPQWQFCALSLFIPFGSLVLGAPYNIQGALARCQHAVRCTPYKTCGACVLTSVLWSWFRVLL